MTGTVASDTLNTDRLLGILIAKTESIEFEIRDIKERQLRDIKRAQDTLATDIERRVTALEVKYAEVHGGIRMLIIMCGVAATLGGLIASTIPKLWGT